jgi:hypothetical protein
LAKAFQQQPNIDENESVIPYNNNNNKWIILAVPDHYWQRQ